MVGHYLLAFGLDYIRPLRLTGAMKSLPTGCTQRQNCWLALINSTLGCLVARIATFCAEFKEMIVNLPVKATIWPLILLISGPWFNKVASRFFTPPPPHPVYFFLRGMGQLLELPEQWFVYFELLVHPVLEKQHCSYFYFCFCSDFYFLGGCLHERHM
jgi:hypothetical protein